ncbi:hypothetical protein HRE53_03725 [Acaryochloris sp. 'Moss Beach']|uniref:hypothetical protein n=1 Tax=Acaryochloris TaxID=155977 RepID=UPI001BAE7B65|nr:MULTISPECIES: hypothetical protein [Acaryochloris]QUY41086.1 hypothetical protein I1H34_17525 [Acaryochloris marina S15]UJB70255.1 hypothetical protein HRE53_03725 [Acaryochloris sp. 'Moss Beach']
MFSGFFLAIAFVCITLAIKLRRTEEVHAVAASCAGLLSSMCSFVLAPPSAQLAMTLMMVGIVRWLPLRL